MSNVILACEILEDEIKRALAISGCHDENMIWIDSSLHMFPKKLHDKLQEEIYIIDEKGIAESILLSFGYCGNAVLGLKSNKSTLVLPKANDCIEMFFYANPDKFKVRGQGCYFLTRGWLKNKYNIVSEYDRYMERYGPKVTKRIMDTMLAHYHAFTLIDTDSYPVEDSISLAEEAAEKLNLEVNCQKGSIQLLVKLFSGNWDDDFYKIPPGEEITLNHFEGLDLMPSQGQISV